MRNIVVAVLMTAMIVVAGCKGNAPGGASGTANPPFQGDLPQDPYVYAGETGVYGGTLVLSVPDDPKTFNIVRVTDNNTADILWFHVFRCPVDYRNGGDPPDFVRGDRLDAHEGTRAIRAAPRAERRTRADRSGACRGE